MSVPFYDKLEIIVPAGGSALSVTDNTNSFGLYWSNGTPESSVIAPVGSICSDYSGGNIYKKSSGTGNTGWVIMTTGTGTTDLGITKSSTTNIITSSTGTNATITAADATNAGLMIPAQFTKLSYVTVTQAVDLDGIEADVDDLTTLSGVASNATNFGTFTNNVLGTTDTAKVALEKLGSAIDLRLPLALTSAYIHVGSGSNIATGVAMSGDVTIDNTGATTVISATSSVKGKVELATDVETKAGIDTVRATTPASVDSYFTALVGNTSGVQHLGTFTGSTIVGNSTVKAALQSLQTSLEQKLGSSLASAYIYVGNVSSLATAVAISGDITLANTGVTTVVSSSTTVAGKVELATDVETKAGSDTVRATTPFGVNSYFVGLVGNASGTQHLGTFTGTTIADNVTVKAALQSLETSVETKLGSSLTNARIFVGNVSNVATGVAVSGDISLSNAGVATVVSASTTVLGKVELSTEAETLTGTSTSLAATPKSVSDYITTLVGNATGTANLGTFTGSTISAASSVKGALQALQTKVESLVSGLQFVGTWDATTAAPTLNNNEFVRVSVAGTTSITTVNQGAKTDWAVGDFVMKDNLGNIHVIDNTDAPVNLAVGTVTTTTVPITNSLGTGFTIPAATTSLAGVVSSTDKTKLNNLGGYQTTYGGLTSNTITHSLGTKNVQVSVYRVSDDVQVYPTIVATSTSVVTITHSIAPSAASFRAVISRTTS